MSETRLTALLSQKDLLIFDFDGTIVDSSRLHERAFNETFLAFGVPAVDYSSIAGLTTEDAVDRLIADAGLGVTAPMREAMIRQKRCRFRELLRSEPLVAGASVGFIRRARRRYLLAIWSSASLVTIRVGLQQIGLHGVFDSVISGQDVDHAKPHPEGLLKILARHKLPATAALVFEDALSGLEGAAAAGVDALCVTRVAGTTEMQYASWEELTTALSEVLR